MLDDLHSDDRGFGRARERGSQPGRPISDREVPLGPSTATLAPAVHAWLDGDTPERDVRRGDWSRDVDFWKRLDDDLAARRRMRTPVHLRARIMDAIPQHVPVMITPWWRREFVVTPSGALLAAATLMAVAAGLTAMVLR